MKNKKLVLGVNVSRRNKRAWKKHYLFDAETRVYYNELRRANWLTLFDGGIDYPIAPQFNNYPIATTIAENKIDVAICIHSLKNLESYGNDTARRLLFETISNTELTLSFNDLLQDVRIELIQLEHDKLIKLTDDNKIVPINGLSEDELIKRIYGTVSKVLYSYNRQVNKKHISYDIDGDIIDAFNRITLATFVDTNKLIQSDTIKHFKDYVSKNCAQDRQIERRLNIIDGLILGLSYEEIKNRYSIPTTTIGNDVKALHRLWCNCFHCWHNVKNIKFRKVADIEESKRVMKSAELHYVGNNTPQITNYYNNLLLEYCNYIF